MMTSRMRNFLDKNLSKFMSRKLFVLILSTVLLCLGLLTPDLWMGIASIYIGVEGVRDGLIGWHSAKAEAAKTVANVNTFLEGKDNNA